MYAVKILKNGREGVRVDARSERKTNFSWQPKLKNNSGEGKIQKRKGTHSPCKTDTKRNSL